MGSSLGTESNQVIEINASKAKARLVYTSYGIANQLMPFLEAQERLSGQLANQFCYEIAVGRVCPNVRTESPQWLFWWKLDPFYSSTPNTILIYNIRSGKVHEVTDRALITFSFQHLQLKNNLFAFKQRATPSTLLRYSGLFIGDEAFKVQVKAEPPTPRSFLLSMGSFNDRYIVVSGGYHP